MESYIRSYPYKGILEVSFLWSGEDEAPLLLPPPVELLLVSNGEDIIYPSSFLFATVSPLGLLIISKLHKLFASHVKGKEGNAMCRVYRSTMHAVGWAWHVGGERCG